MTKPSQQPQPQQNVRCIKDSFGNYTCTDGARVIHDSFDNAIVIPPRREERARLVGVDVRFAQKAIVSLRGSEMTRWAKTGLHPLNWPFNDCPRR